VDGEIAAALRRLVKLLGTDRSTLIEVLRDGNALRVTHSWAAPGIDPFPEDASETLSAWYAAMVLRGVSLKLSRLPDDLPAEATAERGYVARRGMKSHLAVRSWWAEVPVRARTAMFRAYRAWSEADERQLRVAGRSS